MGAGLGVVEGQCGDIAHGDPGNGAGQRVAGAAQQHIGDGLRIIEFTFGADDVATLAFLDVAGGQRDVGRAQGAEHLPDGDAVGRHALRINDDLQFAFRAAVHIDETHARYALDALLDHIVGEVAIGVHRAAVVVRTQQ